MDWDQVYSDLKRRNWIVLLILSAGGYFLMSRTMTLGIILGGFIVMSNLNAMQHTICRAFPDPREARSGKASLILKSYLRLTAMAVLIYLLIRIGLVHPVGLAVGLSTVVIGITSLGISRAWQARTGEAC